MKSKKELNAIKEEIEALNRKLSELSEEELVQVTGGVFPIPNIQRDIDGSDNIIIYNDQDE